MKLIDAWLLNADKTGNPDVLTVQPLRPTLSCTGNCLSTFWAARTIGNFPKRQVNRARNFLHLGKIDFVDRVAGLVIVLMLAVEKENDRNAFARVVVMVAAEEKAVGIAQDRRSDSRTSDSGIACSHFRSTRQVQCSSSLSRSHRSGLVPKDPALRVIRVAFLLAATDHVDIDLRHDPARAAPSDSSVK